MGVIFGVAGGGAEGVAFFGRNFSRLSFFNISVTATCICDAVFTMEGRSHCYDPAAYRVTKILLIKMIKTEKEDPKNEIYHLFGFF